MIYFGLILCFTIGSLIYYLRTDNEEKGEAETVSKSQKDALTHAEESNTISNIIDGDFTGRLRDEINSRD
jgi:hypothetical protein